MDGQRMDGQRHTGISVGNGRGRPTVPPRGDLGKMAPEGGGLGKILVRI